MFNSETLEVAVGMAFLFLLMALVCTGIKEWLEGIFKWRAMDLERALRTLLDDEGGRLTAHLFTHPLISSLFQGKYEPSRLTGKSPTGGMTGLVSSTHMALTARRNLPSYIPAGHFAKALIDLVARGPADADNEGASHGPLSIDQLRERAAALSSPFLRRAVLSAIDHSSGDLKQLTDSLKEWFDGSMDRASGWYKRRTQSILFALGLGAAVVLNVDALYVMGRLTADKSFRDAVVGAAAKIEAPGQSQDGVQTDPLETARNARKDLDKVGMPMGWRYASNSWYDIRGVQMCAVDVVQGKGVDKDAAQCEPISYSYMRMVMGWLVTAFAVMLGAPFWFDVLNKFMVIRSTVKPREKSPEEGSEDRTGGAEVAAAAPAPAQQPVAAPLANALVQAAPAGQQTFVPHQWRSGVFNSKEVPL